MGGYNDGMIRRATVADVPALGQIINDCAEYGLMLHRSYSDLYEAVRDYYVAVEPIEKDGVTTATIVGVCGLKVVWSNLAEIYALAVAPAARGRGLGRQLVEACVEDARALGIRQMMSLTYEKEFFLRLGFVVLDRQQLPLKVWSECLRCPKNQACDEIAMIRTLDDVPVIQGPTAPVTQEADAYDVPVPLVISSSRKESRS